jgi:hypothetical protein
MFHIAMEESTSWAHHQVGGEQIAFLHVVVVPYVLGRSFRLGFRSSLCFTRTDVPGAERARVATDTSPAAGIFARFL